MRRRQRSQRGSRGMLRQAPGLALQQPARDGLGNGLAGFAAHVHADVAYIDLKRFVVIAADMRSERNTRARRTEVTTRRDDIAHWNLDFLEQHLPPVERQFIADQAILLEEPLDELAKRSCRLIGAVEN